MSNLSIENVINISVSQTGQGAGKYNTSNLAIFTQEDFAGSFGNDGYKIYLEPTEVAADFGSDSMTYKKALSVFSQQPNILAGDGYLVVISMIPESQTLTFSAVPDAGSFVVSYDGDDSSAINHDDTLAQVQDKIRSIAGLEEVTVTGSYASGFSIQFYGVFGDAPAVTTSSNTLEAAAVAVTITVSETQVAETLPDAINRSSGLVEYFGLMVTQILSQSELSNAASAIQPLNKIGFFGSNVSADLDAGGKFDLIRQAGQDQTRCLFYGGTEEELYKFVAAYAGRALSTNFSGVNTTQTMHLKDLIGVASDSSMTQTLLNKAQDAGVDAYVSIQGVSKTFTSGGNRFFDDVYNLLWFVGGLRIAGFNVLAQTGTKIAQTENGVDGLKSAYRRICEQAVTNQFVASGAWTSPTTFGIQEDFFENIEQRGYYIYSVPVAQQPVADREARVAPLIQIAIKYAGAIHKSSVIVNINR